MELTRRPIETGIYLPPRAAVSPIHGMHPGGGGLHPALAAEFIRAHTQAGDVVLDPFGGNGATAIEALRLGRRAVTTDPSPLASFFTEVVFTPASLPRLEWALADLRAECHDAIAELFATACPKCGRKGVVHFLHRENGKLVRLDYSCACSPAMLSKNPDAGDRRMEVENASADIPFWHPAYLPLPADSGIPVDYPADFLRRRTVAALSIILNSINNITEPAVRDAMKFTFAEALGACHCPTPLLGRESSKGGNAAREKRTAANRRPERCVVSNPWDAFAESFRRVYAGKQESNSILRDATIGYGYGELESKQANVVILGKAAEDALICELPEDSVDYTLTEPPFHSSLDGNYLPAIQAAWLKMEFDHTREINLAPEGGADAERYRERMRVTLRGLQRVAREGSCAHFYCQGVRGTALPAFLALLESGGLGADHIHYQPAPARRGGRADGGYIARVHVAKIPLTPARTVADGQLREKAGDAARDLVRIYGRKITAENILRSFYQRLDREEISALNQTSVEPLLKSAEASFADRRNGRRTVRNSGAKSKILDGWRRTILDAESLAAGAPDDLTTARRLAVERLGGEGLTAEDVAAIRQTIPAAEILRNRRNRTSAALRAWGAALGHTVRLPQGTPAKIIWRTSTKNQLVFTLDKKEIRIACRLPDKSSSEWGAISCLALERGLGEWCRTHPAPGASIAHQLGLFENISEMESSDLRAKFSPLQDFKLKVAQNRKICEGHYLIEMELPADARLDFLPGQFFHILCDPGTGKSPAFPLTLRRPLSIHRAVYPRFQRAALAAVEALPEELRPAVVRHPARIDFLYRVVGEGTEILSRARKGSILPALGPCGNGFSICGARTAVIVSGGIGVAPLAALAERLREHGKEVLIYLGAVRKEMLNLAVGASGRELEPDESGEDRELYNAIQSEFDEIGARVLTVCTDDGSLGAKGLVTEMLEQGIREGCVPRENVCLYACGPEGMLRAVAEIAARNSLDCQVTLETRMACGVGACYSCTTRVTGADGLVRRKRVCREGPVFEARDIQWKD